MKVLVAGEVKGRLGILFDRVKALNASKAGPFDILFCVGDFYPVAGEDSTSFEDYLCGSQEAPLPTYFIEGPSASAEAAYGAITAGDELCANVKYLGSGGLELIGKLTVGFLAQNHTEADIEKILTPASSSTFLGTDIFLTTHWGQRVAAGYDLSALFGDQRDVSDIGSSTVADVAVVLRPRYHFATRPNVFFQRPPYKNHGQPPKTKMSHITRFISLADVSTSKDKDKKWLHAINIEAIPYLTLEALVEEPAGVTPSPYQAFASSSLSSSTTAGGAGTKRGAAGEDEDGALKKSRGMSHEMAQQIQREEEAKQAHAGGGMFFWGGGGGGRGERGRGGRGGGGAREVDPTNTTVFVGGLPAGYPINTLESSLSHYGKIITVRAPPGKDYAFIQFTTHAEAQAAIDSRGITLGVQGIRLGFSNSSNPRSATAGTLPPRPAEGPPSHYGPAGGRGTHPPAVGDDESQCWFCVGSEKAELELLVTIGETMYMAVPKGPLTSEHVLLIPINHVPALAKFGEAEWNEFEKYKTSLRKMYAEKQLRMVLFERRLDTRGAKHTHVQVIPIPEEKAPDVRNAFESKGQALGVFFENLPPGKTLPEMQLPPEQQYLYLEIPGLGGHGVARLLHRIPPRGRLPLQYGRDVLAELLGVPEKVNWKSCELSKPEEAKMIEDLKHRYAKYDFNDEEG